MFNKERKNGAEKKKKKLSKNDNENEKSTHKSKTKGKNVNRNTYVDVSWSFVRTLCLQVDLRFAFTLFYK